MLSRMSPFLVIQSDWNEALWESNGKCWIMAKQAHGKNASSLYGDLITRSCDHDHIDVSGKDGFEVLNVTKRRIRVKHAMLDFTTTFVAPCTVFHDIHTKSIIDMDISCGGGLGVSTSTDGCMFIWDTNTGISRRHLEGHLGEVNCCKFFPSGVVVLSGGSDTQMKIWSAEDGSCPRTLNGSHQGGILSIEMIGRGKNVLSVSRDGCVNMWECGSGECVGQIASEKSEINSCHLTQVQPNDTALLQLLNEVVENDENVEFSDASELIGKLLALGCENGNVEVVELSSKKSLFVRKLDDAVNCCRFLSANRLLAGTHRGQIVLLDIASSGKMLINDTSSLSPVLSLYPSQLLLPTPAFWASYRDGRCVLYRIANTQEQGDSHPGDDIFKVELELTGSDCDAIYRVVETKSGVVYTCCRDGKVRKYKVKDSL